MSLANNPYKIFCFFLKVISKQISIFKVKLRKSFANMKTFILNQLSIINTNDEVMKTINNDQFLD